MQEHPEFKSFSSIETINKLYMHVTQKIHGSNAQVLIYEEPVTTSAGVVLTTKIIAGSRTRWLTPDDDNYGFANWVQDNSAELITKLGHGRHYGEWCGQGINSGEGLTTKMFVLFDWWRYADAMKQPDGSSTYPFLMDGVRVVPLLYKGRYTDAMVEQIMADLKATGSHLTPAGWFMRPEGIVIDINGVKYKHVFEPEDTAWRQPATPKVPCNDVDVAHLLQPIRLQKLISRDERYVRNYPETLSLIVQAYVADLVIDNQYNVDDKPLRKSLGRQLYPFVKHFMETA